MALRENLRLWALTRLIGHDGEWREQCAQQAASSSLR